MSTFSSDRALYEDFVKCDSTVYDEEAVRNSIRNILLTPVGTMPGLPEFGSRLMEIPFSQNDMTTQIIMSRIVYEALSRWEKRIVFTGVTCETKGNKLEVIINYYYVNSTMKSKLSLGFLELS